MTQKDSAFLFDANYMKKIFDKFDSGFITKVTNNNKDKISLCLSTYVESKDFEINRLKLYRNEKSYGIIEFYDGLVYIVYSVKATLRSPNNERFKIFTKNHAILLLLFVKTELFVLGVIFQFHFNVCLK
jgi:hypothetical protein